MNWLCSVSVAVVAASALAAAQEGGSMASPTRAGSMGMTESYVGCVEAGDAPGSFVLTHVSRESRQDPSMNADGMKKDSMKNDAMMKHDDEAMDSMSMPMAPSAVVLTGSSVSKKYVGRKVLVTGPLAMGPQTSLAVKSVKVLSKSCS